ncbi:hypothetical protein HanRHA438_Chr03g0117861 [Helianthus annuus]|nr:hypothetical protein HanRHA438_Chr03g0117861 [Helianthus annuus]
MKFTVLCGVFVLSAFGERPRRPKVLLNFFCCEDFLRSLGEGCETYAFLPAGRVPGFRPSMVWTLLASAIGVKVPPFSRWAAASPTESSFPLLFNVYCFLSPDVGFSPFESFFQGLGQRFVEVSCEIFRCNGVHKTGHPHLFVYPHIC